MRFLPTDEQAALAEAARGFLSTLPGPHSVSEVFAAYDDAVWSAIVDEQGWPALQVPEASGGWGFGLVEAALVFEEAGRALVPSPLFGTCALATSMLLEAESSEAGRGALAAIAEGSTATAALEGRLDAVPADGGWRLSGQLSGVVDGASADWLVVPTSVGAFVVAGERVLREAVPALDPTRPLATLTLEGVLVSGEARLTPRARGRLRAGVLLAAEQVGGAAALLELSVDYAKVRHQYGRPIGSFQAIQHTLADMFVAVESARSAVWYAAAAWSEGRTDAELAARTAKAMASDAYFRVAGAAIQVHGGIGFTWEHVAHLHFKRARAGLSMLGSPSAHRAVVGQAVVGGEAPWT